MRLRSSAVAGVTAVVLALGACAVPPKAQVPVTDAATQAAPSGTATDTPPGKPSVSPTDTATTAGAGGADGAPAGFEDFYTQSLTWTKCATGYQCATARAPMSWSDPTLGEIRLNLKKLLATGAKIGSLLINPGGPGASGTQFVSQARDIFGIKLLRGYDIVGFDPRGVRDSSAVVCLDDQAKDAALAQDFTYDAAGIAAMQAAADEWAAACQQNTGELLGQVDTQSAARDMDMLRAVLGDAKLNYFGYSYGTQLGATYAGLFPDRVGRMVLDGAIDITLDADQVSEQQAVGFENALRSYVTDCLAGSKCPLHGTVDDGMAQIRDLLDRAKQSPFPTGSARRATQTVVFTGIAVTLYDNQSWPILSQALTEVFVSRTARGLLYLNDFYHDRADDGTYTSNTDEAFRAIDCLDGRGNPDVTFMNDQAKRLAQEAPTVGQFFAYGGVTCANWPYPVVPQDFDVHAKGAPPIVVIGTTGDPATPYAWAQALSSTLDSGVLVTWHGEGHTAYGRSNSCVADAVESYLVDGVAPQNGLTC